MAHLPDTPTLLAQHPLFRDLAIDQRDEVASACEPVQLGRLQYAFRRGDPANALYLVVAGTIKLAVPAEPGREKVVALLTHGDVFGHAALFLSQPRLDQAQALEASRLLRIGRPPLDAAIATAPGFAQGLLADFSHRMTALLEDIEAITLRSAAQRTGAYLRSLPRQDNQVWLPANKSVIASKLGLTPETLSRLLHHFTRIGAISVRGRHVLILDPGALATA